MQLSRIILVLLWSRFCAKSNKNNCTVFCVGINQQHSHKEEFLIWNGLITKSTWTKTVSVLFGAFTLLSEVSAAVSNPVLTDKSIYNDKCDAISHSSFWNVVQGRLLMTTWGLTGSYMKPVRKTGPEKPLDCFILMVRMTSISPLWYFRHETTTNYSLYIEFDSCLKGMDKMMPSHPDCLLIVSPAPVGFIERFKVFKVTRACTASTPHLIERPLAVKSSI